SLCPTTCQASAESAALGSRKHDQGSRKPATAGNRPAPVLVIEQAFGGAWPAWLVADGHYSQNVGAPTSRTLVGNRRLVRAWKKRALDLADRMQELDPDGAGLTLPELRKATGQSRE